MKETKEYKGSLTATINAKGVLDVDTVKGCTIGMRVYKKTGCYGLCYANKIASFYGYDFSKAVSRNAEQNDSEQKLLFDIPGANVSNDVIATVKNHHLKFFRVGTMGDPCHDWALTANVCETLSRYKVPVIVTKHWIKVPDDLLGRFKSCGVIFNTSISALDTEQEIKHRTKQHNRLNEYGIKSVYRIVTCKFGETENGRRLNEIQKELISRGKYIDNPLRIPASDKRVLCGDIIVCKKKDLNSDVSMSLNDENAYVGHCDSCSDQCGLNL